MSATGRLPRLHVIVGDDILAADDHRRQLLPVLHAGGSRLALHLRARRTDTRRLFRATQWLAAAARESGALVIVNDRVDVALAGGAGGVHLREDSLPAPLVRSIAGQRLLVGRSIHAAHQARELRASGLDYLVLGAVYPTQSHPGRPALGIEPLADAVVRGGLPVLAIGGVTPGKVPEILERGAHGVVVLSGVWRARMPQGAVTRYLQVLHR